ncbi:inter-alpha-trypsin inhibitor heavy chain H6 isoform 2-T2 [Pholidichthys leucotaenia]
MMSLKSQCLLVFFTLCMQEGLFEDYEAHLGTDIHLQRVKRQSKPTKPMLKVTDYFVKCSVVSRYAITTIQSSVWNQLPIIKEAAFEVDLPSSAFISNFTITSNGKVYVAQVKERAAARKIYDAAKKQGKTAGLVATKEREIEKFRVAVSVPSGAQMSFLLSYEELLPRRLGHYELSLGLRPGQLVQNVTLDVSITERTGISFIKVLPLRTSRLISNTPTQGNRDAPASTQIERSTSCARIHYSPTLEQQNSISSKGLNADFLIHYDVDLRDLVGDVQVYDGYFVHYFAPRGLPVVPKDVIFVIDISGSMIGTKIKQTKQAMNTILGDLREGDHFNIITFSDKVHTWKKGRTVQATRQNVREAKEFVKAINAEGWTNINAALLSAAQLVNPPSLQSTRLSSHHVPLVIFLTDGEATIGVTSGDTILGNAKKALGSASLFGLAFGDDADFLLLRRLALDNRGVARMVYEDADAALQLKGFYDEVASPLLSDIQLSYLDDQVFDITRSLFPNYFQGSELIVAGRVKPGVQDLKVLVSATDSKQHMKLENAVLISNTRQNESIGLLNCSGDLEKISSFIHRLWAYFTIKELLLAKLNTTDPAIQRLLTEKATNLSLKYNFVTPVTSLVVVKPDADEATQTPTTPKPTAAATITTTATMTATSKIPAVGAAKRPGLPPNQRANKIKPALPQPPSNAPQPKKTPIPIFHGKVVSASRKTTTTSNPSSFKTAPALLFGKKPTISPNYSKTAPPPPRKTSTSLLNVLKAASPPAPGKVSTTQPSAKKTNTPPTTTTVATFTTSSTSQLLSSVRTDLASSPRGRHLTSQPHSTNRAALPPVKVTGSSTEADNCTMSAPYVHQPELTAALPMLTSPTLAPAPVSEENNTKSVAVDVDLGIATLLSATFIPMPGATDGPRLWEAAGILDIDLVKDYDATYEYDYDLNYDTWDDTADSMSVVLGSEEDCPLVECLMLLEPLSRLSTVRVFSSSVDGDPHFVVQLPKLHQNLCFTVDGRANDVLRLLEDPERNIIVDGHLTGGPSKNGVEDRFRNYFDQLTISSATGNGSDIMITLLLDTVVVEGEGRDTLPIVQQGSVVRQGVTVTVDNHRSCWIKLAKGVHFLVLFHHYKHPSYLQMAHLGFYITEGQGLSGSTQGLLGQFQHADISVTRMDHKDKVPFRAHKQDILALGILRWGSQHIQVTLQDKTLKDSVQQRHLGRCWVVPKAELERLLGHSYENYVVEHVKF